MLHENMIKRFTWVNTGGIWELNLGAYIFSWNPKHESWDSVTKRLESYYPTSIYPHSFYCVASNIWGV